MGALGGRLLVDEVRADEVQSGAVRAEGVQSDESQFGKSQTEHEVSLLPHTHEEFLAPLQDSDVLAFQSNLWALLDKRVALYTSGESSSIPLLVAHEMLESVLYLLDIDLDALGQKELQHLANADLNDLLEQGLCRTKIKLEACKALWKEVCLGTPLLKSIALKDTLNALDAFFATYDYRYFAAKLDCSIDYPLCDPVNENLCGIDYVHEYLSRLILENDFLGRFNVENIKALMKAISPDYRVLILNFFEPVAINALALVLVDGAVKALNVNAEQRTKIAEIFTGLPSAKAKKKLVSAAEKLCTHLRIENGNLREYVKDLAVKLYPRLATALSHSGLEGIFLTIEHS